MTTVCEHSNWAVRDSCAACEHEDSPLNLVHWQTGIVRAYRAQLTFEDLMDRSLGIERGQE